MTHRALYLIASISLIITCGSVLFDIEASTAENTLLGILTIAGFLIAIYHKMPDKD